VTVAVAVAAEAATEAPEQEDDEDDYKYESDRHDLSLVTTPNQTFLASSHSDCEAPFGIFRMTHNRGCHPGNAELLFLDGNAALADVDLDAGRLVPFPSRIDNSRSPSAPGLSPKQLGSISDDQQFLLKLLRLWRPRV
jgi:hypothetical protein